MMRNKRAECGKNAQRHVSRRRKRRTGVAQGRDATMVIHIHFNVLWLLNDNTVSRIQRSCHRKVITYSIRGMQGNSRTSDRVHYLSHSPEDNGPKLWTLQDFHTVLFSLKELGRENPERVASESCIHTQECALSFFT